MFPYLLYDAVNDSRTRPTHRLMDGIIKPIHDPFWATRYPPNGYRCRCTTVALTERQAAARGGVTQLVPPEAVPDAGWDYHGGEEAGAGIDKALAQAQTTGNLQLNQALQTKLSTPSPLQVLPSQTATLDQVKALGAERYKELVEDFVFSNDPNKTPMMKLRGKRLGDIMPNLQPGDLGTSIPALRESIQEALVRQRGAGQAVAKANGSIQAVDLVQQASAKFPTEWVIKANSKDIFAEIITSGRGSYNWGSAHLRTTLDSTVEHEYAHHVQSLIPELQALFQEEHSLRTAGEPLLSLQVLTGNPGYSIGEETRKDKYHDPYIGKEYGAHGALEVMSMGVQAVLGNSRDPYANELLGAMVIEDPGMVRLVLGTLFHWVP